MPTYKDYKEHVIATNREVLTSGFKPPSRPDHYGCDFTDAGDQQITKGGVAIVAIADGTCVECIVGSLVGYTIALSHEGKILTRYQHMRANSVAVKKGDYVKKGQPIGVMGNTGLCMTLRTDVPPEYRGTHLHFAVKENSTAYNNGSWVDPMDYLLGKKTIFPMQGPTQTTTYAPVAPKPEAAHVYAKGQTIMVKQSAQRYTNGAFIPARVKGQKFTVAGTGRETVLLSEIMSWLYEADVEPA